MNPCKIHSCRHCQHDQCTEGHQPPAPRECPHYVRDPLADSREPWDCLHEIHETGQPITWPLRRAIEHLEDASAAADTLRNTLAAESEQADRLWTALQLLTAAHVTTRRTLEIIQEATHEHD